MEKNIKCLLLKVDNVIISEVVYISMDPDDISGSNIKLIKPHKIDSQANMVPWIDVSDQDEMFINSDNILTMVDPKKEIIEKYLELTA